MRDKKYNYCIKINSPTFPTTFASCEQPDNFCREFQAFSMGKTTSDSSGLDTGITLNMLFNEFPENADSAISKILEKKNEAEE